MTPKLSKLFAYLTGRETKESSRHRSDLHKAVKMNEEETNRFVAEGAQRRIQRAVSKEAVQHVQG